MAKKHRLTKLIVRKYRLLFYRKCKSLYTHSVMTIFSTIMLANLLSFFAVGLFRRTKHYPSGFEAPLIMLSFTLIISLLIGTVISAIATRSFMKPLNDIQKSMKKVSTGDFSASVSQEDTFGPIDELVQSYNRMLNELNSIELFREDFINSFSHEFKTPIVSIQGFAKQLKKDNLSDKKRQEYIDIIISESNRLTNLSSNILLLNKLENQQILSSKSEFRLDEQIRNSILLLEKQWTAKNIDFDIDLNPITFNSNPDILSQVWLNIISNSIKFSNENTTISVVSFVKNSIIRIDIIDQGAGMNQDTIKHIFDRFYQNDSARSGGGNGLGLSLVKRIIELCDGKIRVESQVGKGTTFSIFFNK